MAVNEEEIEKRLDRVVANEIVVSRAVGGVAINTMGEVFEFAKMMAISGVAVPKHLRSSPGACLAICIQAFEWEMSPFAVANKSYSVNDRLGYESQLIHAVIEARAPLEKRLRDSYAGEGDDRQCTISGTLKGDATPFEVTSPKIRDIGVKNSPLWKSDPDQQLFYYTSRAWARRYVPDVLLGIYSKEELAEINEGPASALDVTPGLGERIAAGKDGRGRGFDAGNIDRALEHKPGETVPEAQPEAEKVVVTGEIRTPEPRKRSHHRKEPSNETAKSNTVVSADGGGEGQAAVSGATAQGDAGAVVGVGEQVGGETGNGEAEQPPVEEEEREPVETTHEAYAREFLEKIEAGLKVDIKTLDEFRTYKTDMRKLVDALEGLSPDQMDQVRGRFSTMMLEAERALAKKKGKR